MTITSQNLEQTEALAKEMATLIKAKDFIALRGDLGAGKTAFVRGLVGALGYEYATSPTFSIVHEYETQPTVFHMDLYRLHDVADLFDLGYEDYTERNGVILMEWPERAESILPPNRLEISIRYGQEGDDTRIITLTPFGNWVERLSVRAAP